MKRLLLILWIVVFTVSCNKESDKNTDSTLLRFNTKEAVWTITRGADYSGDMGSNPIPDMLVYGYYTGGHRWIEERMPAFPLYMDATVVTNTSGTWTYSPLQYFYPTGYHSFFAFAPYQFIIEDSRNHYYFPASSETPALKYHLPDEITNHKDILLGWSTDVQNGSTPVNIAFKHITTKITFSARVAEGYTPSVKINSILLSNIYTEAIAEVKNTSGSLSVTWSKHNDPRIISATKYNNGLKDIVLTTSMQTISEQELYMIPQEIATGTITEGTSLTLSTEETKGGIERTFLKTFNLGATTWSPGKTLNFQITYSASGTEILLLVDPGKGDPGTLTPIE